MCLKTRCVTKQDALVLATLWYVNSGRHLKFGKFGISKWLQLMKLWRNFFVFSLCPFSKYWIAFIFSMKTKLMNYEYWGWKLFDPIDTTEHTIHSSIDKYKRMLVIKTSSHRLCMPARTWVGSHVLRLLKYWVDFTTSSPT